MPESQYPVPSRHQVSAMLVAHENLLVRILSMLSEEDFKKVMRGLPVSSSEISGAGNMMLQRIVGIYNQAKDMRTENAARQE